MTQLHAPLAPSSAHQWVQCSGSVAANFQAPAKTVQRTREGEAAHWVGEQCLRAMKDKDSQVLLPSEFIGKPAPNGVVIDDEMAEGAEVYRRTVLDICGNGHLQDMRIEERVACKRVHPDHCWGTPDVAAYLPKENALYIWDYKHGHREVTAVENWQLICYVAGLADVYPINDQTVVVMGVIQPFCYHGNDDGNEWRRTWKGLQPYVETLRQAAERIMGGDTSMTASIHCRDCAAVGRCATARKYSYSVATYANEPYAIETMKGPDLAAERTLLDSAVRVIQARLEAIEDQLKNAISKGDHSSGLTLEVKSGRIVWSASPETVVAFGKQFGIDLSKPGVLTPIQAAKKVPSGIRSIFEEGAKRLTKQSTTGMALVPVENSKSTRAFSQ